VDRSFRLESRETWAGNRCCSPSIWNRRTRGDCPWTGPDTSSWSACRQTASCWPGSRNTREWWRCAVDWVGRHGRRRRGIWSHGCSAPTWTTSPWSLSSSNSCRCHATPLSLGHKLELPVGRCPENQSWKLTKYAGTPRDALAQFRGGLAEGWENGDQRRAALSALLLGKELTFYVVHRVTATFDCIICGAGIVSASDNVAALNQQLGPRPQQMTMGVPVSYNTRHAVRSIYADVNRYSRRRCDARYSSWWCCHKALIVHRRTSNRSVKRPRPADRHRTKRLHLACVSLSPPTNANFVPTRTPSLGPPQRLQSPGDQQHAGIITVPPYNPTLPTADRGDLRRFPCTVTDHDSGGSQKNEAQRDDKNDDDDKDDEYFRCSTREFTTGVARRLTADAATAAAAADDERWRNYDAAAAWKAGLDEVSARTDTHAVAVIVGRTPVSADDVARMQTIDSPLWPCFARSFPVLELVLT